VNSKATRRILVIDDDANIRDMVALLLEDEGYQVSTASDGQEALALLAQTPPDLILLDMKMARMDGWQFTERYRQLDAAQAPVVVMTAAQNAEARATEVAADGFIEKPFDADALLQVIAEHTG
jgi:CheY-like chemotaxis protein